MSAATNRPTPGAPERRSTSTSSPRLTSLVSLVVLALFPLAALSARFGPVDDPDAFWHIVTGRLLWKDWTFVGPDPLSTFTSMTWVRHEWLPELVMARADAWFGLPGVAWLGFLGIVLLFLTLFAVCRTEAGLLPSVAAAAAGWVGASGSMTPRPQLVSFILLAVTIWAWRGTARDGRPRWWLIALTWVWACSHGFWFVGVLQGGVVVLALALSGRARGRALGRLALVLVLSLAAAAITPVGPSLLRSFVGVGGVTGFSSEWAPPALRSPYVAVTVAMLVVVLVVWARQADRPSAVDVALWLTAVGWSLLYSRTVVLGAVIVAPIFASCLAGLLGRPRDRPGPTELLSAVAGATVALLLAGFMASSVASRTALPTALNPALDRLPTGTVVFDDYSLGGWLLYRHPRLRPVVDPRTELFSAGYLTAYGTALAASPGWSDVVRRSGATVALLPTGTALALALEERLGWRRLAVAGSFVLLERS